MRKQGYSKADRGFYIVLSICLIVIAVSSYVLFFTPRNPVAEPTDQMLYLPDTTAPVTVPDVDIPAVVQPEPEQTARTDDTEQQKDQPEEQKAAEPTAAEPPAPIWVKPVGGAVLKTFSGDSLVKDETMGDWRVHTGTDYAADPGTRVCAVADGTVTQAEVDPLYGGMVCMDLRDGKQVVYQCLGEKLKVRTGDPVRAGDVIGTVGTIGYAEGKQPSHLHLELYANGQAIDPESILQKAEQTAGIDLTTPETGINVEE